MSPDLYLRHGVLVLWRYLPGLPKVTIGGTFLLVHTSSQRLVLLVPDIHTSPRTVQERKNFMQHLVRQ